MIASHPKFTVKDFLICRLFPSAINWVVVGTPWRTPTLWLQSAEGREERGSWSSDNNDIETVESIFMVYVILHQIKLNPQKK